MPQQLTSCDDDSYAASAKGYLDRAMVTGRYSSGLATQFDAHVANRSMNIFQVLDEITALERRDAASPSRTKPASEFKGEWLCGLWHKHFPQARFIAANLLLHWNNDKLLRLIEDIRAGGDPSDEQVAKDISHRYVLDGYAERSAANRLTGEWIVFARQDDINYYLTLGTHTENDEAIWRRCRACAAEFSKLEIVQTDR